MTTTKAIVTAIVLFVVVFTFMHSYENRHPVAKTCVTQVVPPPDWHGGLMPLMAPAIWPHVTVCN